MLRRELDVLMLSDLRFSGGTSASMAEEITALARAGYRVGLLHVPAPLLEGSGAAPMNPKLRRCASDGRAELLLDDTPVHARLLVMRHPGVFAAPVRNLPELHVGQAIMVVNQPPADASQRAPFYDLAQVSAHVREAVGDGVRWAPIGPLVRASLLDAVAGLPEPDLVQVDPVDWHNIIDVDAWNVPRSAPQGRPVVGRHSRPHYRKWPEEPDVLLDAYPDDGSVEVRVLGGAEPARAVLGRVPASWTVHGFDEVPPRDFLAGVDVFVYLHHTGYVEAFGRTILEALASGAVAVVPPHFAELFADACVYAAPGEVRTTVQRLTADPQAYLAQSARGVAFVREHFGHESHVRRVAARIGEPSGEPAPGVGRDAAPDPHPRRVLMISSNGAGVGHLTRLYAMARRAGDVEILFFTVSSGFGLVVREGFPVEFLASQAASGISSRQWNPLFRRRLSDVIRTYRPGAVVFDGTFPYGGLLDVMHEHPGLPFVWSRRGMWRPGQGLRQLARADDFDLVLEPGEFAGPNDRGATAGAHAYPVERVRPVTVWDREDLLDPAEAKRGLGLDPDRPAVLVTLGAGNINETGSATEVAIRRLALEEGLQVCVTHSAIADSAHDLPGDVRRISVYPLSPYYPAFDFAVSAAGYNSFHELVGFGVPAVYLPNTDTALDDQAGRARYAEQAGVGLCVERVADLTAAIERLLDPATRDVMRDRCLEAYPGNGAREAMQAVVRLLDDPPRRRAAAADTQHAGRFTQLRRDVLGRVRRTWQRSAPSLREALAEVPLLERVVLAVFRRVKALPTLPAGNAAFDTSELPSGRVLSAARAADVGVLLVVLLDLDEEEVASAVERVARAQSFAQSFKPVFVVTTTSPAACRRFGFHLERVMPRGEWERLEPADAYQGYVEQRLDRLRAEYRPAAVLSAAPGTALGVEHVLAVAGAGRRA